MLIFLCIKSKKYLKVFPTSFTFKLCIFQDIFPFTSLFLLISSLCRVRNKSDCKSKSLFYHGSFFSAVSLLYFTSFQSSLHPLFLSLHSSAGICEHHQKNIYLINHSIKSNSNYGMCCLVYIQCSCNIDRA